MQHEKNGNIERFRCAKSVVEATEHLFVFLPKHDVIANLADVRRKHIVTTFD